jgi:hypothetical protein
MANAACPNSRRRTNWLPRLKKPPRKTPSSKLRDVYNRILNEYEQYTSAEHNEVVSRGAARHRH